jgi:GntR family transcriptional repressor for pyruvate dehydrogenase complex
MHNDNDKSKFNRIRNSKVSGNIVSQIKNRIVDGTYKPGDKLPPEKELLEIFAVSRSSLREALRTLEEMGLIVIKRGAYGGAYVTRMGLRALSHVMADVIRVAGVSFEELSEMRVILEPDIARLAALNRTDEDIKALDDQNGLREKAIKSGKVPIIVTIDFHQIVARAAGNRMIQLVVDSLASVFQEEFRTRAFSMDDHAVVLKFHQQITEFIKNRDPDGAFQTMRKHITDVTKRLRA